MAKPIDERRAEDPTLDFLLRWRDGAEPRPPPTMFDLLTEVACDLAERHRCRVSIEIREAPDGEGMSMNIAPETLERLIRERMEPDGE